MTPDRVGNYVSYLIRMWREDPGVWRGMVEDPQTGARVYFKDVDELVAYLRAQIELKNGLIPE